MNAENIAPGIWKVRLGTPEQHTPASLRTSAPLNAAIDSMGGPTNCPIDIESIRGEALARGFHVTLPLGADEQFYGLGLQLKSFNQRTKKKTLRVNSDPTADLGDSHAPVPFYVSTAGYGVLVDTARYASFYFGVMKRRADIPTAESMAPAVGEGLTTGYDNRPDYKAQDSASVDIDIPAAKGVDIYVFAGPSMVDAVRRYNLYSGGGPLPPRWGLGVCYRPEVKSDAAETTALARDLRETRMPCDVIGLEPGWQTTSYSCSFVWSDKFPDPAGFVAGLAADGFRVNLWTHAFTASTSPIYDDLKPLSGSHEVWNGLIPDFTIAQTRQIFADFHEKTHVDVGVSGYKLDECDNSDFIPAPWSFSELTQFPSGLDGEQYHSLFGHNYQETLGGIFARRGQRTYGLVRNAHAFAAPNPFVLYSDLYEHADFIRGLVNCGFSGLLWTPEVRHAVSEADLVRRLQAVVFSPLALINAWYIRIPPWKQWRTAENNDGKLLENWEALTDQCREILNLRMQFLPYLYAAYVDYHRTGAPPFRALVMDWPGDTPTHNIDSQLMMGDRVMAAPITAEQVQREVYLPEGRWRDYWTGELLEGSRTIVVAPGLDKIPLYVKDGSVLPLAAVTPHVDDPDSFKLTVNVYGDGGLPARLIEDDGETLAADTAGESNTVDIAWDAAAQTVTLSREGTFAPAYEGVKGYSVADWRHIA